MPGQSSQILDVEDAHTSLCVGVFVELDLPLSNHNLYQVIQWKVIKEKDNPRIKI